jgi:hypothetical protein
MAWQLEPLSKNELCLCVLGVLGGSILQGLGATILR